MTVFVNTTICGDEHDAAPVQCPLEATGPGATPRGLCAVGRALHHDGRPRLQWPVPLSLRPWRLGRLGGGAAAPRCCAALALTRPPPAKGLHASTRCPAEATTLIGIRVFFGGYHTYRFAYLSFAYPPHIINSRIYDVGINCHKYVKYVDSRTALLCLWCSLLSCLNLQHILWLPTLQCSPWLPHL